jgi:hypothetical protein
MLLSNTHPIENTTARPCNWDCRIPQPVWLMAIASRKPAIRKVLRKDFRVVPRLINNPLPDSTVKVLS